MRYQSKIILSVLWIHVFIFVSAPILKAEDNKRLIRRFNEKIQKDLEAMKRFRDYQKTQEKLLENQRIVNQQNSANATQKIQEQNRIQRVQLETLRKKMENIKRQQSYYSQIKTRDPLSSHFRNMRNTYK